MRVPDDEGRQLGVDGGLRRWRLGGQDQPCDDDVMLFILCTEEALLLVHIILPHILQAVSLLFLDNGE